MRNNKVAIISELVEKNINYGNRLQAYALNQFLVKNFDFASVDSLMLDGFTRGELFRYTKIDYALLEKAYRKLFTRNRSMGEKSGARKDNIILQRERKFDDFLKSHPEFSTRVIDYNGLINSNYDIFIVGSDVVWGQIPNKVQKIKFLDFNNKKDFKRISYAPSMLKDYFPKENRKYVKRCLEKFDAISVRDGFSARLLKEIGIQAQIVCDPTMLLSRGEWEKVAKKPDISGKYIFVYLLGENMQCREKIEALAKELELKIVTIPCADGKPDDLTDFGDYKLEACSPEEWIGLIRNAEYFFTDSFHGTIFATIFEKRLIVVNKDETGESLAYHPPARMIDFLERIGEQDKYMPVPNVSEVKKVKWDYSKINKKIGDLRVSSIRFLEDNLL